MIKKCRFLLLTLILAISIAACSCLIIACDVTPQDTSVTYTVTVKTDSDTPAQGVKVQIKKGSVSYESKTTDADGKVAFTLVPDSYTVSLDNLPDGYNADNADLTLTADKKDLTITLNKNFAYTIKLVDQNGAAYYQAGVTVMICTIEEGNTPGTCLTPVTLGSNGIATIEANPYNYHAKINGLPANAKYECDSEGYYTEETLTATKTELTITITVYTITSVTDTTPMTMEEKTAFAEKSSYTADDYIAAYYFKTTLNAGKAAYYCITPEFDGDYSIYYTSGSSANYLLIGTTFNPDNQGNGLFTAINGLKAGNTYYLTVLNNQETAVDFEFVIEAPSASHSQVTLVGDIDVTIAKEGANAIIEFKPSIGAAFKLTAPANISASIIEYDYNPTHPADSFKTSAECAARFTEDRIGSEGILHFSIAVQNVSEYPVTFKVTLEKTATLTNTTNEKHAEATLAEYGAQEGTLTYVPMNGTAELVKDDNGIYHLGTADGPVVVVMLKGNLPANRFASTDRSPLVYIDKNVDGGSYKLILDVTEDKTSLTQGNTFNDYRLMLRGFADYKATPTATGFTLENPDEITEQHYYAKYANEDGVYPLTDELKTFLQVFAATYSNKINATEGEEWLFACCYYSDEDPTPGDDDVIVGTYENEDGATLTVNADNSYLIVEAMGSLSGTWSKTPRGTYLFVENNESLGDITYLVVIESNKILFYDLEEDPDMEAPTYEFDIKGNDNSDEEDAIVGTFENEDGATLTVNANGTYSITEGMGSLSGTWSKTPRGTYLFVENNPTFGDTTFLVVIESNKISFYEVTEEGTNMDEASYEFDVKDDDNANDKDTIVGEYSMGNQMMGNYKALTVNEDGTWSIVSGMGTNTGTWSQTPRGTYLFVENNESLGDITYLVVIESNKIIFYDLEMDPDMEEPVYEFDITK